MAFEDEVNKLIDRSIYYRGAILYKCIILENEIENYILRYFSSDFSTHIDMHEIITDRMNFDSKIAAFQELLKRNISPLDDFEKIHGKLFSELRYLKDVRNRFAHFIIDLSFTSNKRKKVPKEFSLINYRNGADVKVFSKGDFDLFNKRIERCMEELIKLNP